VGERQRIASGDGADFPVESDDGNVICKLATSCTPRQPGPERGEA
jgi:hypothetical protein